MRQLWQDLRFGLRQLKEDKGFSIAAILTLTLGIGATASILIVVNTVLLSQIPYHDPSRLLIGHASMADNGASVTTGVSQMDVADWRERSKCFSDISVEGTLAFNLEQGPDSQRLSAELVNYNYFSLLGLQPVLGRFFSPEEDAKPMERFVVVLGNDLWRHTFGAEPGVIGRKLQFNGRTYQVVGVGPRGFHGISDSADLWIPSMVPPIKQFATDRGVRWAQAVARLAPGITLARAEQEMKAVTGALAKEFPEDRGIGAQLVPLKEYWFGDLRNGLLILTVGAFILLLIACINVAGLLLTRTAARQRAWSIRVALGASRGRLLRQLVTESVLLSLLGAAAGLLLAQWASRALLAVSGLDLPSFVQVHADPQVVAAVVGLAVVCGVGFGLTPIWISFRSDITQSLGRDEQLQARGTRWHRFQSGVVIVQVALALALSAAAVLMAKSFHQLMSQDLGFRSDNLLTFRMDPRGPKYREDGMVTKLLNDEYLRRLAAVPGVAQMAIADPMIPGDSRVSGDVTVEDHESQRPGGTYNLYIHAVSAAYFEIFGIPILRGRAFTPQDRQTNAVIISQAMADEHWPGKDPLGKRIKLGTRAVPMPWLTVVGVAAEVRYEGLLGERSAVPDIYLPVTQFIYRPPLTINFLARPKPGVTTAQLRPAMHREMTAIDPELPDYDVSTMQDRLIHQTDKARFQVILITTFTLLALVLVAVGIYGVVSYSVAQRVREIAIRMSLGADRESILRLVVVRGAKLALAGLAAGLLAVFALSGLLAGVMFHTSIGDPLILGGTCLGLFAVALAANYLPARRAARLEPMNGLRK